MYSVMWSEHCSYKSSKIYLKKFAALPQQTPRGPLLAGIGDNAGVVDIGNGLAVTAPVVWSNGASYSAVNNGYTYRVDVGRGLAVIAPNGYQISYEPAL